MGLPYRLLFQSYESAIGALINREAENLLFLQSYLTMDIIITSYQFDNTYKVSTLKSFCHTGGRIVWYSHDNYERGQILCLSNSIIS